MCSSTYATWRAGSTCSSGRPAQPVAASASPKRRPSALTSLARSSSPSSPQNARLPSVPVKVPSSSANATTSTPPPNARAASSAATTPSPPSRRPPKGTESTCDPASTAREPGDRPSTLPTPSISASRPASARRPASHSRARTSSSVNAGRCTPRPLRPIALRASRSASIRSPSIAVALIAGELPAPVLGDLAPGREPHALVREGVVEEPGEPVRAARAPDGALVQADRHEPRPVGALRVQLVERVAQVVGEVASRDEPAGRRAVAHVVGLVGVGDDEMIAPLDLHPVGQLVVERVAVVEEPALLDDEGPRAQRRPAGHPPHRALAGEALDAGHRPAHELALGGLVGLAVVDPAVPVGHDLVAGLREGDRDVRVALQRLHDREEADLDPPLLDHVEQAPDPDPAAVLVGRLHEGVALADQRREGRVGQRALRGAVAVQDVGLRARLVVHGDLDRDARAARPARVRGVAAVADHVARVVGAHRVAISIASDSAASPDGIPRRSASASTASAVAAIRSMRASTSARS